MFSSVPFGSRGWQLAGLLSLGTSLAASAQAVLWRDNPELPAAASAYTAQLRAYRPISVQLPALRAALLAAPAENGAGVRTSTVVIALPTPEGGTERFRISQVTVMHPLLAAKYPSIKTYQGQGIEDPSAIARLDVSPAGFHAMVSSPRGRFFIDPAVRWGDDVHHLVFSREAMKSQSFVCEPDPLSVGTPGAPAPALPTAAQRQSNGTTLKTYRLALANSYEYAAAVGNTPVAVAAAKVTSINRINGVYEREIAVRLVLVANNNLLDYIRNGTAVPNPVYTDASGSTMLNQNQTNVDREIGSANYDVGHVFSTGGGGVAQKPSVCSANGKARGVTGSPVPVGDAFDIDYVAHELGHQFNCNHTFNNGSSGSCAGGNRAAITAYEPGSGVTIMAYAGICSPEDFAQNSIDIFHSASFDEVLVLINGAANGCAVRTPTNNTPPVAANTAAYTIPKSTPFSLTGSATDADNDPLTYEWEQFDKDNVTTAMAAPSGNQPIFRPFLPTTSPTRIFPRLSDIIGNRQTVGERLPTYARVMNFRFIARDNRAGGGGVDYGTAQVTVAANAGPLLVTNPNTANIIWQAGAPAQVTWDVAGTNLAPVSAANVDLLLSTDGGLTYPIVLATATPNDGNHSITVPLSTPASTTARVMVRGSGNIFFDISNQNFTVEGNTGPTFFLAPAVAAATVCPGVGTPVVVTVGQITGFTGTVVLGTDNLPAGFSVAYAPASVAAGATSTATISAGATVAAGSYNVILTGTSGGVTRRQTVGITVSASPTTAATAQTPATTGTARTIQRPRFTWTAVANATSYELQVSTSSAFAAAGTTTYTTAGIAFTPPASLLPNTTYFWRVRGTGICGNAPYSNVLSFLVGDQACVQTPATQVPRSIPGNPSVTVTSVIAITNPGRVAEVRVRGLTIEHSAVNEIEVTLTNPAGVSAVLIARNACPAGSDYLVSLDDQAAAAFTCPASAGATYRPATPLSALTGGPATGNWTLTITDNTAGNGGQLTAWTLDVCTLSEVPNAPTSILATYLGYTTAQGGNNEVIWTIPSTGSPATTYELQRAYLTTATWNTIATVPVASGAYYSDFVTQTGRYFYRVRACNVVGCSEYTTEASVLQNRLSAQQAGITVSPNPSTGVFVLTVDNAQRGALALRVSDALGRTVLSEQLTKSGAALQHTVDLGRLAPGVYNLHLALPDGSVVTRLLKQ